MSKSLDIITAINATLRRKVRSKKICDQKNVRIESFLKKIIQIFYFTFIRQ